jgi:hypothetical protein
MSKETHKTEENTEIKLIKSMLDSLKEQHNIGKEAVLSFLIRNKEPVEKVPVSIFRLGLSPLQALVKYLFENKGNSYNEISKLLNRDERTIWNSYDSTKNIPGWLVPEETRYYVDLSIFRNRNLSFLENLCCYLKENYSLTYHKIAILLGKDDRTVWTVCKRAEKKNAVK